MLNTSEFTFAPGVTLLTIANFWLGFAFAAAFVASPIAKPRVTMMLHFWLMNVLMMGV